jgi:hypothetical protein
MRLDNPTMKSNNIRPQAMTDYAITFACYNQVDYTRQCVDSLVRHGYDLGRVVAVDNGSSDATRDYLQTLPLGGASTTGRTSAAASPGTRGCWPFSPNGASS